MREELREACILLPRLLGMEVPPHTKEKEALVNLVFILQELVKRFVEHPNYTPLCLTHFSDPWRDGKLVPNYLAVNPKLWGKRLVVTSYTLNAILTYFTALSHCFKGHVLGVKAVNQIERGSRLFNPHISNTPPSILKQLGIPLEFKKYFEDLINEIVIVVPSGVSPPVDRRWIKVRVLGWVPYFSYPKFFSIRGTNAIIANKFPNLLFCTPIYQFKPYSLIDFLFYFFSERWVEFTVDLINFISGATNRIGGEEDDR